jgi:UDP-glucose 4-epimerase
MRLLVTGGCGFIGTHLCRRLLAAGHSVVVVDNESNGSRDSLPPGVEFIKGDVTRPAEVEPAFAGGLDAVFNIAGQVSIIRAFSDPTLDLRTNVEGTLNVLRLCVNHKVPRLVHASSMTLYGDCQTVPTPESQRCEPDSYYGITKLAAERYVHATAMRSDLGFSLAVTSLRMFSVFGPGQSFSNPYQGVLGIFSGNVLRGEPITIFGDGEQTRDFVYVGDVVDAWMGALETPPSHGKIMNIGSGRSLSINELARHVVYAFGAKGHPIVHAPTRPGEQRSVRADIGFAKSVMDWQPRTSFEQGLANTVRWAREEFAAASAAAAGGRKQ